MEINLIEEFFGTIIIDSLEHEESKDVQIVEIDLIEPFNDFLYNSEFFFFV